MDTSTRWGLGNVDLEWNGKPPGSTVPRPYVFMVNTAQNVYFNSINNSGSFNGWTAVGVNVGAVSISAGTLPITNTPYVVMINGNHDIYYNSQSSSGAWTGWSSVGINVGAVSIATGVVETSQSPTIFEPYVFMTNTAHNVYYSVRQRNGTWSRWSAVGISVGAASISATTISNKPTVTMLNTAGNIYMNALTPAGKALGWLPVGAGTGSGATPADASTAIVSSFQNYELRCAEYERPALLHLSAFTDTGARGAALNDLAERGELGRCHGDIRGDDTPFAFAIGTDGNVYWADQTSWATWSCSRALGAPN